MQQWFEPATNHVELVGRPDRGYFQLSFAEVRVNPFTAAMIGFGKDSTRRVI